MTKTIHKADSRGHVEHGWLTSDFSFSFADYHNPEKVRFGLLRVLNDDTIQPGQGFGTHPHDNMEIVTIPLKGELAHKDSMGSKEVLKAGEVQIMSAGSGLTHSEFNNSNTDPVSLLQLWVFPKEKNIKPRYAQSEFDREERVNKIQTVVSPDQNDSSLLINQDAYFSLSSIEKGNKVKYDVRKKGNGVYVFLIEGEAVIDGEKLSRRDAVGIEDADEFEVDAMENAEVLFVEVPMN